MPPATATPTAMRTRPPSSSPRRLRQDAKRPAEQPAITASNVDSREAFEAARAAAAGKNRAEIREIYLAERQARGLPIPSDLVLDAYADAIARDRGKFSVAYSARVLAEMGRDFGKLISHFWSMVS